MKRFLFLCMAAMMMVACTDDGGTESGGNSGENSGNNTTQATLSVSSTSANFATEGGEQYITITSSSEWTASIVNNRADDWCWIASVNSSSGETKVSGNAGTSRLKIVTKANETPDERTAIVVVVSGILNENIKVIQKQKDALTVTSSTFEVTDEGGEIEVEVIANIDFDYVIDADAQEWITYQTTRALNTSTLVFAVAENDNMEKREGKITIKSGDISEEITIYQIGEPAIVLSQNEYAVSPDGETITVEVKSNVDVNVEMPADTYWITENHTRSISTNKYYFDIRANDSYEQRSAEIIFTNVDNGISESVKIVQAQNDAVLINKKEFFVSGDGGVIELEVQANVDYDITAPSAEWVHKVTTRGLETNVISYEIDENSSYESRYATINVLANDETTIEEIKITQYYHIPNVEDDVWDGTIAASCYSYGNGTKDSPYMITSCSEVAKLAEEVNQGNSFEGKYFLVIANLDFNNHSFTPIGKSGNSFFSGYFDGNGKKMLGLSIAANEYQGLFGYIKNATIDDVYIDINTGFGEGYYVGGVAGCADTSTITNCCVFGQVVGDVCAGSIVAFSTAGTSIRNCYSACQNTFWQIWGSVGGLVGYNCGDIQCCYFYGSINAAIFDSYTTGGVVGYNDASATLNNCYYMSFPVGAMQKIEYCGSLNWGTCYNCGSFDMYGYVGYTKLAYILNDWVNQHQTPDNYYRKWTGDSYPQFVY